MKLLSDQVLDSVVVGGFNVLAGQKVTKFLSRNTEVPESCSAEVVIREMASTIKTEVLTELSVTNKRLHQTASDFVDCNTLTIQVSICRYLPSRGEKSHIVPKAAACRERCFNGVRDVLNAMKVNRTLLCERESLTADVADFARMCTPSAKETLGM